MATPGASREAIGESWSLDAVFSHLLARFEGLPNPSSVAEGRLGPTDCSALASWYRHPDQRECAWSWCNSEWQDPLPDGQTASRQEMFGGILLVLAAEVCRDQSNEEAVWPSVTRALGIDRNSRGILFAAGQPTTECKKAIAAGARRLGLRNVIDRYGTQEYFDTVKLQFGFTLRGAKRRLAEWLDGQGTPLSVRILNGEVPEYADLRSESFASLWSALQDLRRERTTKEDTAEILQSSCWIRQEWTEDLLHCARLRLNRVVTAPTSSEAAERTTDAILEPRLLWEPGSKPQLILKLDEERITELLAETDSAQFCVDGRTVDRWFADETGRWRGRRDLTCQQRESKPNLRPGSLSIVNGRGELIYELALADLGLSAPLLIFDMRNGGALRDTSSVLDRTASYAVLCDTDLAISGREPLQRDRRWLLYRIEPNWPADLHATCDGEIFWQPRSFERPTTKQIRTVLESAGEHPCDIGSAYRLRLGGVPEDASDVNLAVGSTPVRIQKAGSHWETRETVTMSLGVALGTERVRARIAGPDYSRTTAPRLSLPLRGVLWAEDPKEASEALQWEVLRNDRSLNRAGGDGRLRIFAGHSGASIYEGSRLLSRASLHTLNMRDLHGWGAPLTLALDGQSDFALCREVEDRGRAYFLSLFAGRTRPMLRWLNPTEPSRSHHKIYFWRNLPDAPSSVGMDQVESVQENLVWKLPDLGSIAALAVTYDGERIAAWWSRERIVRTLRSGPRSGVFAVLRWLKIPVLSPSFQPLIQEAMTRAPVEWARGWFGIEPLPAGMCHDRLDAGWESVARELLWNLPITSERTTESIADAVHPNRGLSMATDQERFKARIYALSTTHPKLAYSLARYRAHGDRYKKCVRDVVKDLLAPPLRGDQVLPEARLAALRQECARLVLASPEDVERDLRSFEASLRRPSVQNPSSWTTLKRLNETGSGRKFLSASLLRLVLEGATL